MTEFSKSYSFSHYSNDNIPEITTNRLYPDLANISQSDDEIDDNILNEKTEENNSVKASKSFLNKSKSMKAVRNIFSPKGQSSLENTPRKCKPVKEQRVHVESFDSPPSYEEVMDEDSLSGSYNLVSSSSPESVSFLGIRRLNEDEFVPPTKSQPPPRPVAPPRRTSTSKTKDDEQTFVKKSVFSLSETNSSSNNISSEPPNHSSPPVPPRRHKNIAKKAKKNETTSHESLTDSLCTQSLEPQSSSENIAKSEIQEKKLPPLIQRKPSTDIDFFLEQNIRELEQILNKKRDSLANDHTSTVCSVLEGNEAAKKPSSSVEKLESIVMEPKPNKPVSVPNTKPVPTKRKTVSSTSSNIFCDSICSLQHSSEDTSASIEIEKIEQINLEEKICNNINLSKMENSYQSNSSNLRRNSHGRVPPLRPLSGPDTKPGPPKPPRFSPVIPPVSPSERSKAVAVYDFNPRHPDELTFQASDVIVLIYRVNTEWLYGSIKGREGMFPEAFVHIVKALPDDKDSKINVDKRNKISRNHTSIKNTGLCKGLYDFQGENDKELSFTAGTMIQLLDYIGDEWLMGEIDEKQGIFPKNFVEILQDLET